MAYRYTNNSCSAKTLLRRKIKYIQNCLKKGNNVSIYIPEINKDDIKYLSNYFKITPESFGYVKFENKEVIE